MQHAVPSRPSSRRRGRRGTAVALALGLLAVAGCGSDDGSADASADAVEHGGDPTLSGIVRDPAPRVDATALPSLTDPGSEAAFRAADGEILVVYWGFTACPDVCPTTLADLSVALRMMEPADAERVELMMVTVDPDRDLELLDRYVNAFVEGSIAAGTDDLELLQTAAEPFGATWEVRTLDDGRIEVDHSPFLYAVDDTGTLLLTWQFGIPAPELAADLTTLLERMDAAA